MDRKAFSLLAILVSSLLAGCSKEGDIGETVPGPPRDKVEKSLPPQMKSNP